MPGVNLPWPGVAAVPVRVARSSRPRALIADGAVLVGAGEHLGAVGGDGELAERQQFELLGQLQDLDKALGEQRLVFAAKGAEGVAVNGNEAGGIAKAKLAERATSEAKAEQEEGW